MNEKLNQSATTTDIRWDQMTKLEQNLETFRKARAEAEKKAAEPVEPVLEPVLEPVPEPATPAPAEKPQAEPIKSAPEPAPVPEQTNTAPEPQDASEALPVASEPISAPEPPAEKPHDAAQDGRLTAEEIYALFNGLPDEDTAPSAPEVKPAPEITPAPEAEPNPVPEVVSAPEAKETERTPEEDLRELNSIRLQMGLPELRMVKSEPAPAPEPQPASQPAPEQTNTTPEPQPAPEPEVTPEPTLGKAPDAAPDKTSNPVADANPSNTPNATPDKTPDTASGDISLEDISSGLEKELDIILTRDEAIAQAKEEEIAQAKEKEIAADLEELKEINRQLAAIDAEYPELAQSSANQPNKTETQRISRLDKDTPLTAITADWTYDKHEMARDLAEQSVNAEVAKSGLIGKIWKGTLFKKYYEQKYTKEYIEGKRTAEDGRTIQEIIRDEQQPTIERFVLGATEDMRYIHEKIGKKNKDGSYDGEKLVPADEKTNEQIKYAIEQYARYKLRLGDKESDIDREFTNQMDMVIAKAIDEGRISDGFKTNNYLDVAKEAAERYKEVAINARDKAEQDAAMARVMAGFQAYNAEVRSNVRTQAHRDNIDKIVNKIESSKIGRFIPSEIVAGAAGAAFSLTQTGSRLLYGVGAGIVASSVISGLRERNRITEDRARMIRDAANGLEYRGANLSDEDIKEMRLRDRKQAKYEKRLGGTLYDMQKASDLAGNINGALDFMKENEDENGEGEYNLLRAMAEARVRIGFSDSEQKDLISYSSADKRGDERLDLDIALIKAEKHLTEGGLKIYQTMQNEIRSQIIDGYEDENGEYHAGVEDQDDEFKKLRTFGALKAAGKTLAIGSLLYGTVQEVSAVVDPNKIGIFEKAGLIKTENAADARETVLSSGFGKFRGTYELPGEPDIQTYQSSDPNEIAKYEANGYTKEMISAGSSGTEEVIQPVDPANSSARVEVKYDTWANNGTRMSDGNELRAHIDNGSFVSNMRGSSTAMSGDTINYGADNIKAFVTVGDSKFEVVGQANAAGQLTWGENGVFTTPTGETIKAIGDNGEKLYRYFEIAADNGVDMDGVQHIIPLATDVGANTFSDQINEVVTQVVEQPAVYQLTKSIPTSETFIREMNTSGIVFPNIIRTGLGEARPAGNTPNAPAGNAPSTSAENTPQTAPEAPEGPSSPVEPSNTANAPEAAPASAPMPPNVVMPPAPEPTPEPAPVNPENERNIPEAVEQYYRDIRDAADVLGDDIVTAFFSNEELDTTNNEQERRFSDAINNLSPEGVEALRSLSREYHSISADNARYLDSGNAFRAFLSMMYPELA